MEISTQTNNYKMMNIYQKDEVSVLPMQPLEPEDVKLSPEEQLALDKENQAKQDSIKKEQQSQQAQEREIGANYLANKSMQSQVEIYLAVATEGKVKIGDDDTATIIKSLRDVQKQNNTIQAYAIYAENQKDDKIALY